MSTVDELINPVASSWDVDLVKAIFWPVDAYRILQIPITYGREDLVAWHFNTSGRFSVRSVYHCQWNSKFGQRYDQVQACTVSKNQLWKNLWRLKVQGTFKIFGWRTLKDLMPCRATLANRHIGESVTLGKNNREPKTKPKEPKPKPN